MPTKNISSSSINFPMNASESQPYFHIRLRRFLPMWAESSPADRIGVVLSGACLVHCLVLPLVLPLLATASDAAEHPLVHLALALLIIPTTLWAAWHGYQHHRNVAISGLLVAGGVVISVALLLGEQLGAAAHLRGETAETILTVAGSVMLVSGHWRNWQHERSAARDARHHAQHKH
jgi:hypothetical protein